MEDWGNRVWEKWTGGGFGVVRGGLVEERSSSPACVGRSFTATFSWNLGPHRCANTLRHNKPSRIASSPARLLMLGHQIIMMYMHYHKHYINIRIYIPSIFYLYNIIVVVVRIVVLPVVIVIVP